MSTFSIRFLVREGCHLCDDARPLVLAETRRSSFDLIEVDIDTDDDLVAVYGLRIPVVLGPDDEVLAEGIIQRRGLRRAMGRIGG